MKSEAVNGRLVVYFKLPGLVINFDRKVDTKSELETAMREIESKLAKRLPGDKEDGSENQRIG